eukprot:CAMPEP_0202695030 /NCGR_PEP_ID=MMETSP1385-20130828/8731_1 /ASSEMBLY_ACC=CAM_ASM_000861 /TAXON_ID=933848 /ORGANISM="Elphidium margaritaceum" /LENGTH=603 /DNA_ID=CAMNT_0049350987 /DNA_START=26 /DNA_END=1834 /DNA_ORIENTATION=+
MSDKQSLVPYIVSGASLLVSCYALYQTNQEQNRKTQQKRLFLEAETPSQSHSIDADEFNSREDLCGAATLSRLMQPDDANSGGNVHGGTILKLIGHVAWLSATKYINRNRVHNDDEEEKYEHRAIMLRMEEMSFKQPMYMNDICTCKAQVIFTSTHSIEVQVNVIAENAMLGTKRHTNSARMWFAGIRVPKSRVLIASNANALKQSLIAVPPLSYANADDFKSGQQRYQNQKRQRSSDEQQDILRTVDLNEWTDRLLCKDEVDQQRIGATVFKLAQVTLPSDCFGTQSQTVDGGYVMKLMDNVAGCVAFSWTQSRVVTVHIDAIDFHAPVLAGNVCHCYGRLIFTSSRSMEILVLTFVHDNGKESGDDEYIYKYLGKHRLKLVCSAFLTFVALSANNPHQTTTVTAFAPHSEIEKRLHSLAKQRYEQRKQARKQQQQQTEAQKYKPTVVVGPSGVGKGTLLTALKQHYADRFAVAVSHTTRQPRKGESHGVHYFFVSKQEFEADLKEKKFVESANIYGNLYGTSKQAVKDVMHAKKICLLEIDIAGANNIKQSSIDANYLFITVKGEQNTCQQRIESRGTETKEQVAKRVQTAIKEFEFFRQN